MVIHLRMNLYVWNLEEKSGARSLRALFGFEFKRGGVNEVAQASLSCGTSSNICPR